MNGPIALFDLDGTLADYDAAMRRDLEPLRSPGELSDFGMYTPWNEARRQVVQSQPGWFRNLDPYKPGFEILGIARELKFDLHVVTKGPSKTPSAWTQKLEWCMQHVPDAKVHVVSDKSLVYGRVLVDDWPPYIERWLEWRPRGLVVMPAHLWNVDAFGFNANVIRYDGNLLEVRRRLEAIAYAGEAQSSR